MAIGCVVLVAPAGAQSSKGILAGIARDATGAVVANATVTVKSVDNGQSRTVKTSSDGAYRIEAIDPGKYTLLVSEAGFQSAEIKNLTVNASQVTSYDVVLNIGAANTEVSVEANPGTINTENGTLTGVVDSLEINKLPIFSLNPIELATTIPGVQFVQSGAFSNGINIQVNGNRPRSNNFLLDGQEINDVGIGGQAAGHSCISDSTADDSPNFHIGLPSSPLSNLMKATLFPLFCAASASRGRLEACVLQVPPMSDFRGCS